MLLLAVALGVLAALAVSPESVGAQLPMLDLACRLGTAGVVYAVLLFLGMFGTSVSSLVAVLTYAGQKSARLAGHRTALLLVLTAAAFAGSLFGFGDLIGTVCRSTAIWAWPPCCSWPSTPCTRGARETTAPQLEIDPQRQT
ncbi:MAG: hypothetical protein ACLSHG_10070 [Oscillospiraceae bacterium]